MNNAIPADVTGADRRRLDRVRHDLAFLEEHWIDLRTATIPGTRRPWAQTQTRAESRRKARDAETYAKTVFGISSSPAPLHVDVLDTLVDVTATAYRLASGVLELASARFPIDRASMPRLVEPTQDPRPWLRVARHWLPDVVHADGGWILGACLSERDELSVVRMRTATATALRLVLGGQVLDAECPWCDARPLRIRVVAGEPLVVCESRRVCEPPEADCGTWVRGRPAWILPEWEWLADRIARAAERASA